MAKFGKKRPHDDGDEADDSVSVNQRVRVFVDTDAERRGLVMEDFGDLAGRGVDVFDSHFADPARRWAVLLDDGTLVFVDSHQVAPE